MITVALYASWLRELERKGARLIFPTVSGTEVSRRLKRPRWPWHRHAWRRLVTVPAAEVALLLQRCDRCGRERWAYDGGRELGLEATRLIEALRRQELRDLARAEVAAGLERDRRKQLGPCGTPGCWSAATAILRGELVCRGCFERAQNQGHV